jgi:hypothetical protein
MKITYTPNPLNTIVELDDHEKQILWYKVKIIEMENAITNAYFHLRDGQHFNLEEAKKDVNLEYFIGEDDEISEIDKHVTILVEYYIQDLQYNHDGNCTCFACSCLKCHAESLLGIDTIPGLGKHMARKIRNAFVYKDGDTFKERTMEEAIEILKNNGREADTTYKWLLNYNEINIKGELK